MRDHELLDALARISVGTLLSGCALITAVTVGALRSGRTDVTSHTLKKKKVGQA